MEDVTSLPPEPQPPEAENRLGVGPRYPAEIALVLFLLAACVSTIAVRPRSWGWLAAAELLAAAAVLAPRRLRVAAGRPGSPATRPVRIARLLLPFALLPVLYKLTGWINRGLESWVLDAPLERLEAQLFGGQPSLTFSERAPWPLLSEFLHACYWAYFVLVPLLVIVLAAQKREREAERVAGTIIATFCLCYMFYIWLPVRSPLYNYPPLAPPLSEGFFYGLTHAFAARGGVVGGAFPSSHAAVAILAWLLAVRHERRIARITAIPTAGLLVATVYGRYHYALDTIAGVVLALLVFVVDSRRAARAGGAGAGGRRNACLDAPACGR